MREFKSYNRYGRTVLFKEIAFASPQYNQELALREAVLRAPLGLTLQNEDLSAEKDCLHFGLFGEDGALLGCILAIPLAAGKAKLRQMAVLPSRQRSGLGSVIIDGIEKALRARGFTCFVLNARLSAAGFYRQKGYLVVSGEFTEVGIPHVQMAKDFSQNV